MAQFNIENLTFSYPAAGGKPALDRINLTIEQGEYLVLCGKSGSGKSTLLKHLKSVVTPHGQRSGRILFQNKPLEELSPLDQAAKIGYVMQNPDEQIVTDKVSHELAFGLENLGFDQQSLRARVAEMAAYFGIQEWFHRDTVKLSGGQKQLLNLASIMALQPEVLILDEPTSQLDPIAASDFLNTIRKINLELGTTIIMTEHRLEEILPDADRVVVMEGGKIIADDVPRCIGKYLLEQGNDMFAAMPAPVMVFYGLEGKGDCPLTVREGRNWLSRWLPEKVNHTALPMSEHRDCLKAALSLKDVWFRYERSSPDVLRGVHFEVPEGCLYGILGGNGSGKSTLLKSICGICKPHRGTVKLLGKPMEKIRKKELYGGCISMLPQDPKSLFVKMTVREELEEMTKDAAKIEETAALCEIAHLLNAHPYDLSGGEQQRTALAKVLLTDPKILLLDEPTKGIDALFKKKLAMILKKLNQQGITVLIVSHDVEFCAQYADRVAMFFDGQILTEDIPRHFFGNNSFYTTAANRMSRHVFSEAVTALDVMELCRMNRGDEP